MEKAYLTVSGYGEARLDIEKSVFLAYVDKAADETAAQNFISDIRKKHWDATHNCAAYIVGEPPGQQKADDDGEPSGTAGKPMLEAIKKAGLRDTVIVVTRYFGGIKLGAGGLIRAYGKSAAAGLKAAKPVQRQLHNQFALEIDYALLGTIENQLKNHDYPITNKEFTQQVVLTVLENVSSEKLSQQIADWSAGQARLKCTGQVYLDTLLNHK